MQIHNIKNGLSEIGGLARMINSAHGASQIGLFTKLLASGHTAEQAHMIMGLNSIGYVAKQIKYAQTADRWAKEKIASSFISACDLANNPIAAKVLLPKVHTASTLMFGLKAAVRSGNRDAVKMILKEGRVPTLRGGRVPAWWGTVAERHSNGSPRFIGGRFAGYQSTPIYYTVDEVLANKPINLHLKPGPYLT